MKILFVAHERNMGGASKSLVTLVQELKESGHQVTVVLPIKNGQVYAELRNKEIEVKCIFFGWWMMPSSWNLLMKLGFRVLYAFEGIAERRIAVLACKKGVQIIHSNSSAIDVGARAAKRAGIQHVWHFREFGDADYALEFLKGKEKSCAYVETVPGKVVFISKSVKEHYQDWLSQERGQVIYNGISEQFLQEKYKEERKENTDVVFLIAGNLNPKKRQDLAIAACRILKERGFGNFRLIVAGTASAMADSRRYATELQESAKELPEGVVEFAGHVKDMVSLRAKTDVELVCSEKEAFGRVTVEAMMASNPVIASDSGANPELVHAGRNGFLFECGNAESLANSMQELLKNPEQICVLGKEAFRFAKETFPSKSNTKQIEDLYFALTDKEC